MNVFVLNTGRCGSVTFARACSHMSNYSSAHESRVKSIGAARLDYPDGHIEVDHFLSWFLGKLDEKYGDDAYYVHLTRDPEAVARSLSVRRHWIGEITTAYRDAILQDTREPLLDTCRDLVGTMNANIRHFLKDKSHRMEFALENADEDWPEFWHWIGAEGDYGASLSEWSVRHNASREAWTGMFRDLRHKAQRVYRAIVPR